MCTLHLWFKVFPERPVVFAGNRDENLDRAWDPPTVLVETPRIVGPRDRVAGGTWLGVNLDAGLLVTLANHEGTLAKGPSACSRGTVVLETLRHASADEARRFAEWVAPACKSYTLLIADAERAFVVDHSPGNTLTYRLLPGCHVITNARFRDPDDPKARRSLRRMEDLAARGDPSPGALFSFLSDHGVDAPGATPLCIHPEPGSRFGTSSASAIHLDSSGRLAGFWFAPGPPCRTEWQDALPVPREPARGG
ncbi:MULTISPECIES: NRDE family protein [Deferrisoma]